MRKRKSGLRTSSPEGPCRRVDEETDEVAEPPPNRLSRARHHSWILTIPFEDAHRYPRLLQLEFPLHRVQEILHSSLVLDSCISIYKVLTHFGALVGYKSNTLFLTVTTALNKVSFLPTTPAFCSWRLEKCIAWESPRDYWKCRCLLWFICILWACRLLYFTCFSNIESRTVRTPTALADENQIYRSGCTPYVYWC